MGLVWGWHGVGMGLAWGSHGVRVLGLAWGWHGVGMSRMGMELQGPCARAVLADLKPQYNILHCIAEVDGPRPGGCPWVLITP
jgi:hypothetical protein